jgi:hypothetical protein
MDPKVANLLDHVAHAMASISVDYAIGGALAMRVHGYKRHTDDVDLFALEQDRVAVLRALRQQGLTVSPVFAPHHYIATVPGETDPESRIDVLFPSTEPDLSAIEFPEKGTLGGHALNVWPLNLVVMAKFYSDRAQDHLDIASLLERGLFDVAEVERTIRSIDEEGAKEFAEVIRLLVAPRKKRGKPARRPK